MLRNVAAVEVACKERGGDIEQLITNNQTDFHVSDSQRFDYVTNEESKYTSDELRPQMFTLGSSYFFVVFSVFLHSRFN